MPITLVAARGSAGIAAVGTSTALAITNPTAIAVGSALILAVATDNSGTDGAAPTLGVTDPRGNTWASRGSTLRDPGLVDEGAFVQVFAATVGTAYQAGDVLTLTASPSTTRGAWALHEFDGVDLAAAAPVTPGTASGATSGPSVSVTPTAADQLVFGAAAIETNVAVTGDSDTVNGSWSALVTAKSDTGNWATSMTVASQHKVVTAAGAQTWNLTLGATYDYAATLPVFPATPPTTVTPTYDPALARVRVAVAGLPATVTRVTVDRSTNGTTWTTVRGGATLTPSGGAVSVDDYEFPDGVLITYRARGYTAAGTLVRTTTATITTDIAAVWLKSATRPFLNRTVTVTDFSDVATPARGAVVDVLGRRLPVAVSGVRGSRAFDLVVRAADADTVEQLALMLSYGDTLFLHVPANCPLPSGGHFHVGDVTERRPPKHDSFARYFTLPLVEVDAPDAGIVGATITWTGVQSAYATWAAVTTAKATWLALNESISAPADEVVG